MKTFILCDTQLWRVGISKYVRHTLYKMFVINGEDFIVFKIFSIFSIDSQSGRYVKSTLKNPLIHTGQYKSLQLLTYFRSV